MFPGASFQSFLHAERSDREYHPVAFTPPRDDFAGLTGGQSSSPGGKDLDYGRPSDLSHATRQSLHLVLRMACCFLVVMGAVVVIYSFIGIFVHEAVIYDCKGQPVDHGQLLPCMQHETPKVVCDSGYVPGAPIKFLTCRLIHEKCLMVRRHNSFHKILRCKRVFAYVPLVVPHTAIFNHSYPPNNWTFAKAAREAVPHACLAKDDPKALVDEVKREEGDEAA